MAFTYVLTSSGTSVSRSDGTSIPADPLNTDWQTYQAWLAAGNTPTARARSAAVFAAVHLPAVPRAFHSFGTGGDRR